MLYKSLIKWEVCNTSAVPIAVRLGTVVVGLALGRNTSVGLSAIFLGQLNFLFALLTEPDTGCHERPRIWILHTEL